VNKHHPDHVISPAGVAVWRLPGVGCLSRGAARPGAEVVSRPGLFWMTGSGCPPRRARSEPPMVRCGWLTRARARSRASTPRDGCWGRPGPGGRRAGGHHLAHHRGQPHVDGNTADSR